MTGLSSKFKVEGLKFVSAGAAMALVLQGSLFAQTNNSGALVVPTPKPQDTNQIEATLRDIKAPVEIPDYGVYLLILLGILIAALIGFLVWKFWLKKKFAPVVVPPLAPHVRAKRKLREANALINEPTRFTVFISDTIRVYLEEQFKFRAPERTTEEFLHELGATRLLSDAQKKSLGAFLSRCDLIKFAKYDPTKPELEDLLQAAMSLVEETEPKPVAIHPTITTSPTAIPAK